MSIESAIVTLLKTQPSLAALVEGRIYALYLPQGETRTALTYQEIGGPDDMTTDGPLGLVDGRWQINCWAASHAACVALRDVVLALLRSWATGIVSSGVTIQGVQVLNRGDIPALNDQAEGLTRYGKFLDIQISYNET